MKLFLIIVLCICNQCYSQKILEIDITHGNRFRKIQLFNGEVIEYKLKGEHQFHLAKITNLNDSSILLSNDSIIKLKQIKVLCIRKSNYVLRNVTNFLMGLGVLFPIIHSVNSIANNDSQIINQTVLIASATLITTSLIIKHIGIKKHRINKNKFLRVIDLPSQKVN